MLGASGLQLRRATYASLIAVWLVASGIVARRHESTVAHAVDGTGQLVHGERLRGHHDNSPPDIHDRDRAASDHGACGEATLLRQLGIAITFVCATWRAQPIVRLVESPGTRIARHVRAIYQLAPKTSPPAA
jgi:hypothetical protein